MTAYLLDTNVVSEPTRPQPDPRVLAFLTRESDLWLSAITIHELSFGAERVSHPGNRARLIAWVAGVRARFARRIVFIDDVVADHAGRLRAAAAERGAIVGASDALIAASASAHGACLATRNVKDFAPMGVALVDPWASE